MTRLFCLVALMLLSPLFPAIQAQSTSPVVVVTSPSPVWGYTRAPIYSPLHGLADLTRAQGEYLKSQHQAVLLREKARQEKLVTRRSILEQMKWEHDFRHQWWEEENQRARKARLDRSKDDAPVTEVLAAVSLNTLLEHLRRDDQRQASDSVRLEAEWLGNINVTVVGGDAGLLRQKKLPWPLMLQDPVFTSDRNALEDLLQTARDRAASQELHGPTLKELYARHRRLGERLADQIRDWTPSDYIESKRFLDRLRQNLNLLRSPKDAAFHLSFELKGDTALELVRFMTSKGLRFAPADAGQERFYIALHDALARDARKSAGK